jgi:hypothetical protein
MNELPDNHDSGISVDGAVSGSTREVDHSIEHDLCRLGLHGFLSTQGAGERIVAASGHHLVLHGVQEFVRHHSRAIHDWTKVEQLGEPLASLFFIAIVEDEYADYGGSRWALAVQTESSAFVFASGGVPFLQCGYDCGKEGGWEDQRPGEDMRALGVELEDEFGDAAKVRATATDSPIEVWVRGGVDGEDRSIGGDDGDLCLWVSNEAGENS